MLLLRRCTLLLLLRRCTLFSTARPRLPKPHGLVFLNRTASSFRLFLQSHGLVFSSFPAIARPRLLLLAASSLVSSSLRQAASSCSSCGKQPRLVLRAASSLVITYHLRRAENIFVVRRSSCGENIFVRREHLRRERKVQKAPNPRKVQVIFDSIQPLGPLAVMAKSVHLSGTHRTQRTRACTLPRL